jgi:hypothetical protein
MEGCGFVILMSAAVMERRMTTQGMYSFMRAIRFRGRPEKLARSELYRIDPSAISAANFAVTHNSRSRSTVW